MDKSGLMLKRFNLERARHHGYSPPRDLIEDPYPRQQDYENIPLEKVKRILRHENINDHWVVIPNRYRDFMEKWGLEFLFDPMKECPRGFNPFDSRSLYINKVFGKHRVQMVVDVDCADSTTLSEHFRILINIHKQTTGVRGQRKERYSSEDLEQISHLLSKEKNAKKILWLLHPEYNGWDPLKCYAQATPIKEAFHAKDVEAYKKNYLQNISKENIGKVEHYRTKGNKQRWNTYQTILRMIRKIGMPHYR